MSERMIEKHRAKQLKLNAMWKAAWIDSYMRRAKAVEDTSRSEFTETDCLYLKY